MGNKVASSNLPKYFVIGFFAFGAFMIFNQFAGSDDPAQKVAVKVP